MKNQFIEYITNHVQLEQDEVDAISSSIPVKHYKAGDILLKEGMISKVSYFNIKGCVRMYYIVDGKENTTFFYTENQFVTSIKSFTSNEPSNHYLECVEDCTLALISYDTEKALLRSFPKLETFSRMILEQELANYQDMLSTFMMSSPEQRYLNLVKNAPHLLQRVPLYQLASYIGVKAESLSRIRSRISNNAS
ncbi:Crp/Fnr family transcriptional regulator [Aureibacter tunicatorum]|uniref:CRP-like cAMP-binding protein n=1 Tax=Aureibacter tunicatorum TaxID=866807 RepID=A0AAE3XT61_9BACT|nr:Crp/Fnr family transcriptional regulator [Aureibacter tunicatorum]MDR6241174.1 CRP-like cAMP-binding protein [Aureibacter tunicatorum]BDD03949.1 cyclic nucleotide-binding protein [Aureibacter tunicatorum]